MNADQRVHNVDKISLLRATVGRYWLPAAATFVSVIGASLLYLRLTPPLYETSVKLLLEQRRVSVSELGQALTQLPSDSPGGASPLATQAELVKSKRVLQRAIAIVSPSNSYSTGKAASLTADNISGKLRVKLVPATNILEVTYQSRDPKLAARVLNAVAEAMVQENADSIRREASSVRKFLEDKVPQQQAKLEFAEAVESRYRQVSGLISFEAQTNSLVSDLANTEEQERTLLAQLREASTRDQLLQQVTGMTALQNAYAAIRVGQDEDLKNLRVRLAELEAKVIDSRSRLGDQHPDMLAVLEQRDKMRSLYGQRLSQLLNRGQSVPIGREATDEASRDLISKYITGEVERLSLQDRLRVVQFNRTNLQARITELPAKQQQLTVLIRQRQEAEASLKLLQSKLEEARIAEAQLVSNLQTLDKAEVPDSPSVPKPNAILVLAVAAGGVLAIGVLLTMQLLDDTIHGPIDVQAVSKLAVLGQLPKLRAVFTSDRLQRLLGDPDVIEPYRSLLKKLEFRCEQKLKVILISSVTVGEGKSDVAARLSAVAAMLSRRTLLIDADLRLPVQHRFFDLSARPGLTDVVSGRSSLAAVQPTRFHNLSVLSHGELLPCPSTVSESPSMKNLIDAAAASYDLVVIDTSSVGNCADATTLCQYADGLLLVVRPDFTSRTSFARTTSELQSSGTPILGVVLNSASDSIETYYSNDIASHQPAFAPLKLFARKSQAKPSSVNSSLFL